ncbi:MAG: hypothetical protein UDS46_01555 [Bacteroidales bacterium]|nr:hypothetical protein [Bacteroidales bacterium]
MKHYTKLFFAAAVAALGLASCAKEVAPVETPKDNLVTVHFGATAGIEGATKATLTPNEQETLFTSTWENGDVLSVEYISPETADNKIITATWTGTSFEAIGLPNETGAWDYTACYPVPDSKDSHIDFGANRTQNGNSYNSIYDVMIGNKSTKNSAAGKDDDGSDIVFNMDRKTAVVYFHLTGGPADEDRVSATLSVEDGFIASQYAYISKFSFAPTEDLKEITITFPENAPKASNFQLWYNVLPTTYKKMTLTVETTGHTMTISRTAEDMYINGKLYKVSKEIPANKWVKKGGETPTSHIWDLTINSTSEASKERIGWTSDIADMLCIKGESSVDANSYYPGVNNRTSTRFYTNSTLSITPKSGISLKYYVFEATSDNYATALVNSTWTNATAEVDNDNSRIVYIIAINPSMAVTAKISAACGFNKVECHANALSVSPAIKPTVPSIDVDAVGGENTISYTIQHPVTGSSLTATSSATWIKSINCDKEGLVTFTVEANEGTERTAAITLSYPDASDVIVSIKQRAAGSEATKTYTLTFGKAFSDPEVTGYTDTWDATRDGFTWTMANWNNNNAYVGTDSNKPTNWTYIKAGSRKATSVATITTKGTMPETISTVTMTIDKITTTYVNSIKLEVLSADGNTVETISGKAQKGDCVFKITKPQTDCKYVITVDCKKGSGNGFVQVSKVVYTNN